MKRQIKFKERDYAHVSQYYGGRSYHSRLEARYAAHLDDLKVRGEIDDWEGQYKAELRVNGHLICNYYVDFLVYHPDGRRELVEVKGPESDIWRFKRRLLEATLEDDVDYTVVR